MTADGKINELKNYIQGAIGRANGTALETYFEVGDRIALAVASTGINAQRLCRMLKAAGVEVCSVGMLRWTVTFAGTFTASQRRTLIELGMPVMRVMALCHKSVSAEKRARLIDRVKRGVTPWTHLEAPGQAATRERLASARKVRHDAGTAAVEYLDRAITFYWSKDGKDPDWEAIENGLRALKARIGAERLRGIVLGLCKLAA